MGECRLGLRVGSRLALFCSSELSQWVSHDDSTINIVSSVSVLLVLVLNMAGDHVLWWFMSICRCWKLGAWSASQAVTLGRDQWNQRHVSVRTTMMLMTTSRCRAMRLHCRTPSRQHWTTMIRPPLVSTLTVNSVSFQLIQTNLCL